MQYLLITTTENRNLGDELIRIGVQNLIREIDTKAEFLLLDKEKWINPQTVNFDKAILCGMPLFWNNEISESQRAGWWEALFLHSGFNKKNFLILGAGNATGIGGIKNEIMFGAAIQQAIDTAFAVTDRDNSHKYHPDLISSICPAAFAIKKRKEPKYKLCTLMKQGAHDRHFNPEEADLWKKNIGNISKYLMSENFYFIEHASKPYYEDGEGLGWPKDKIIRFNTAEEYLDIYAQAQCYIGNRLHGALLVASIGRPALAIGYDSRLGMVEKIGGLIKNPSTLKESDLFAILGDSEQEVPIPETIEIEREKNLALLERFIYD